MIILFQKVLYMRIYATENKTNRSPDSKTFVIESNCLFIKGQLKSSLAPPIQKDLGKTVRQTSA